MKSTVSALMGATILAGLPFGVPVMAAPTAEELQVELDEMIAEAEQIEAAAAAENRELTDEEDSRVKEIAGEGPKLKARVERARTMEALRTPPAGSNRRTTPDTQNRADPGSDRRVPASPRDSARHGFRGLGQFALAVVDHARNRETDLSKMLVNAATTFGSESSGADGGFLVPPEYAAGIMTKVQAEDGLLSRALQVQTERNALVINKDETTPWGSAGIQVYWESEAGTIGQSKPKVEPTSVRLVKLAALVPLTDELLEDAVGLDSLVRAIAPGRMNAAINTGFVRGTGVGQPLGMLNSASLISVNAESSQAAATLLYANIVNMFARMYAPWRRNAVWLINQDIEPALFQLAFDPDATSKVPAYMPPGGLSASPYGTLLGRPVIPIEAASSLGTQGDIILVDMQQYLALTKAGGVQTATSIHLYFDQALTALRFIFRINGQPLWSSTIVPENGSNNRSWAVALDTRN